MSRALSPDPHGLAAPGAPSVQRRRRMLGAFKIFAAIVAVYLAWRLAVDPGWTKLAAAVVAAGALFPAYLWCAGRVGGVPLFPLFSVTYLWTYAYPLAGGNPEVEAYGHELTLFAGLAVAAALGIGTLAWYMVVKRPYRLPGNLREMAAGRGDWLLIGTIFGAVLFTMSVIAHWQVFGEGIFSVVRAALIGLCSVGIFALAYRLGRGELPQLRKIFFVAAFLLYLVTQMATLLIVSGLVAVALFAVGYAVGARRLPLGWIVALIAAFALLHVGKHDMRERYWYPPQAVQPWEYPAFFTEWFGHGVRRIVTPDPTESAQLIYERVGLVQLLLRVLDEAPERTDYLMGETYAVVPQLLVPRLFNPDKPSAHEGTTILNVHYGLQSREDTLSTTIGWGLLNEAIANFGVAGIVLFGLVMGGVYGWVTRVTADAPLLSLRMLVAITFMGFAIQTEFTAGVYVSALFQSLVALFAVSLVFMRRGGAPARPQWTR